MNKPKKTEYPSWIKSIDPSYDGKFCLYILKVENCMEAFVNVGHYFKFGITSALRDRMRKHFRDFTARTDNFGYGYIIEPCMCIDCGSDAIMRKVESEFKNEAAKSGILRNRYDKTEIIYIPGVRENVNSYVTWIRQRVATLQQDPEFAHRVEMAAEKKLQQKTAAVGPTLVNLEELRGEFRREVDQLRLLYRTEIERLELRIRELEIAKK